MLCLPFRHFEVRCHVMLCRAWRHVQSCGMMRCHDRACLCACACDRLWCHAWRSMCIFLYITFRIECGRIRTSVQTMRHRWSVKLHSTQRWAPASVPAPASASASVYCELQRERVRSCDCLITWLCIMWHILSPIIFNFHYYKKIGCVRQCKCQWQCQCIDAADVDVDMLNVSFNPLVDVVCPCYIHIASHNTWRRHVLNVFRYEHVTACTLYRIISKCWWRYVRRFTMTCFYITLFNTSLHVRVHAHALGLMIEQCSVLLHLIV